MTGDFLTSLIGGGTGALGVAAFFITMIVTGHLHTDAEMRRADDLIRRADEVNQKQEAALERQRDALAETRRALAEASARADASIRATEVVASAMTSARESRHGSVPQG
jgi:hypothetical protein